MEKLSGTASVGMEAHLGFCSNFHTPARVVLVEDRGTTYNPTMAAAARNPAPGGTETILLVQPEPESRTLAAFMLVRLGYTVLEARSAMDALKLFEDRGATVDLLLAEMRMPRCYGQELAWSLAARNPALRVLFMADPERAMRRRPAFLPRPFTMRTLAKGVRDALDRPVRRPKTMTAGTAV